MEPYARGMVFLSPMDALVGGAVALPVLLGLYFLKLRRRPARVSSVLFWGAAKRDAQVNVPWRMIRPSWLLFLHLLIVGLLLGAMARPAIEGVSIPGGRAVLLVDVTASMSARERGGRTRLEIAKEKAKTLARDLTRAGVSVGVVAFGAEAEIRQGMTRSRSLLEAAIEAIEPTDQGGDLEGVLRLGAAVGREEGEERVEEGRGEATLIVVGDGGYGAGEGIVVGARVVYERVGPSDREAGPVNAGVVRVGARRDYLDPGLVRALVEVRGTGAITRVLTISLDGQVLARRGITLERDAAGWGANASFEFAIVGGGVLLATLDGGDALTSDDQAGVVLRGSEGVSVTLVRPAEASAADFLLEEALAELKPRTLRVIDPDTWAREGEAGADLVILDRVPGPMPLRAGVIAFGVAARSEGVETIRATDEALGESPVFWTREHPVMRDVVMEGVVAAGSMAYRGEGVVGWRALVFGPRGEMIGVEEGPPRRVHVGFGLARSNWALQAGFAIFLANAVEYVTGRGESGRAFTTGEAVEVRADGAVEVVGLDGVVRASGRGSVGGVAVMGAISRAGVYRVRGGAENVVCVNVGDARESALASPVAIEVGGARVEATAGLRGRREIWWALVLVAAALLVIEWVVYGVGVRA